MIELEIPGFGDVRLSHVVLDLNGTIACDGELVSGVAQAVANLRDSVEVVAVTADTHGTAAALRDRLSIPFHLIERGAEEQAKLAFVESLGCERVAVIGNGANDAASLAAARVGVAVIGCEGACVAALSSADVVCTSIVDALALFERPARLLATLRS